MSEANFPENSQAPNPSSPAWYADWGDFSAETHHDTPRLDDEVNRVKPLAEVNAIDTTQTNQWDDWQPVDFPNALSVDAIAQQPQPLEETTTDYWTAQAAPAPLIDLPTWAQNDVESPDSGQQPPISDLISLIQELNQCNSALIDRVSQLEDALEHSEQALQAEIGRSHDQDTTELIHPQVDQLVGQLEVAHQTHARQQDLLETLSVQFDSSQERVAQLERECVQLQQRYTEQAQMLSQRDAECHDLHIRLHRQQRYTLQFKVALEKCLEVAPSPYESVANLPRSIVSPLQPLHESRSSLNPQPFLPKVPRIQPWSADQSQSPTNTLKLESLVNRQDKVNQDEINQDEINQDEVNTAGEIGNQEEMDELREQEAIASIAPLLSAPITSAPVASAPVASVPTVIQLPFAASASAESPSAESPAAPPVESVDSIEPTALTTQALELGLTILKQPSLSSEAIQAGLAELQSALGDWSNPAAAKEVRNTADHASDRGSDGGDDSDAEALLWQDLARLIDISSDDVVNANQAQDFDSFETRGDESAADAPSGNALDQLDSDWVEQTSASPVPHMQSSLTPPVQSPIQLIEQPRLPLASVPQKMAAFSKEVMETLPASLLSGSSPSPVVYPLRRPTKKLESLAAVDLPTFPR